MGPDLKRPVAHGGILWHLMSVALLLFAATGAAEDYDALNNGVVKVVSVSPDGKHRVGTGFIVKLETDSAYIVTAYHVLEGDKQPSVYFYARRNAPVAAQFIRGDGRLDAALLIVRGRDNVPQGARALPLEGEQNLKRGDDVTTIGFPAGLGDWAVTKSTIASQEGFDLTLSGAIAEGSSGGPVLQDGRVVAMVNSVQGIAGRATPALMLRYALNGWGVDVATGAPPSAPVPTTVATPAVPPTATIGAVAHTTGETFKDCDGCPEVVVVTAGRFTMGSPRTEAGRENNEGPTHEVAIARAFAVGKYEVTRGQFAQFVRDTKRVMSGGSVVWDERHYRPELDAAKTWRDPGFAQSDDHPVVCVSYEDAKDYVQWLAAKTGKHRLPGEAEWEYAARAGSTASRFWGDAESAACMFANVADRTTKHKHPGFIWQTFDCDDSYAETAPVGRFKPNGFGLYDMLGNAWEWLGDCWHDSYNGAPVDGSLWLSGDCASHVIRGGGWFYEPRDVRSAVRSRGAPDIRYNFLGFRVASTLP